MATSYKIIYNEFAIEDLRKIMNYLSSYRSPQVIDNFDNAIQEKMRLIKHHPHISPIVYSQHGFNYHKLVIKSYIFVYIVDDTNEAITILRVFHELEDYQRKLG